MSIFGGMGMKQPGGFGGMFRSMPMFNRAGPDMWAPNSGMTTMDWARLGLAGLGGVGQWYNAKKDRDWDRERFEDEMAFARERYEDEEERKRRHANSWGEQFRRYSNRWGG